MKNFDLTAAIGYTIQAESGRAEKASGQGVAATLHFYHAAAGDTVTWKDAKSTGCLYLYRLQYDERYIYSYEYPPEQSLTTFDRKVELAKCRDLSYTFREECYFRLVMQAKHMEEYPVYANTLGMKRIDLRDVVDARLHDAKPLSARKFTAEIRSITEKVKKYNTKDALSFLLLADTHAAVNGTWLTTLRNIRSSLKNMEEKGTSLSGILHMGDLTDGVVPRAITWEYNTQMLNDLNDLKLPLYTMIGNHDTNYFRENPDRFSDREIEALYFQHLPGSVIRERGKRFYYEDHPDKHLRCIYLDSFDPANRMRYGYPDEELTWLSVVLFQVPKDYCVIVFSHVPPTPRLHFWSKEMRNYWELTHLLRQFHKSSGGRLLGFVHGHCHADQIDYEEGFPIISLGCTKCEDCTDIKLPESVTPARRAGDASEDLWTVMIADASARTLRFLRFGAGEDMLVRGKMPAVKRGRASSRKDHHSAKNGDQKVRVITYGSYDLFHSGHYNLLRNAKALGDYLIVGVTTEHYDEQRGKVNVVDPIMKRIENVRKTGLADEIIIEDHEGQKIEDIQRMNIDVFTVGSDWTGTFEYLKPYCKVIYLPRTPDISSTSIRATRYPVIRFGVVGTGRIAPRFIAEAKYVSGLNMTAVYNPHRDSAETFASQFSMEPYYGDFDRFLRAVDAIYIASPHDTHYEYTRRALKKGVHVLCEKPLCFTAAECDELFGLAYEKNTILMEGIKTAYCPGFIQLVNVAKSGKIGEIRDVEACFSRLTDPTLREMTDAQYGGAFMEFGSYTTLPIIKLLGTGYEDVTFNNIRAANGIDLYSKIQIRYPDAMATSKTGIGVKSEGQLIIAGTEGYILAQAPWWLTKRFEIHYEDPDKVDVYTPEFQGDGLRYEISEFSSRLHGSDRGDFKLTRQESVAMADLVERFLRDRRRMQGGG